MGARPAARRAHSDSRDASPSVEPGMDRPKCAVIRRSGKPAKPSAARRSLPRWSSTLLNHVVRPAPTVWDRDPESLRDLAPPAHRRGDGRASARRRTRSRHVRRRWRPPRRRWPHPACPLRSTPRGAHEQKTVGRLEHGANASSASPRCAIGAGRKTGIGSWWRVRWRTCSWCGSACSVSGRR